MRTGTELVPTLKATLGQAAREIAALNEPSHDHRALIPWVTARLAELLLDLADPASQQSVEAAWVLMPHVIGPSAEHMSGILSLGGAANGLFIVLEQDSTTELVEGSRMHVDSLLFTFAPRMADPLRIAADTASTSPIPAACLACRYIYDDQQAFTRVTMHTNQPGEKPRQLRDCYDELTPAVFESAWLRLVDAADTRRPIEMTQPSPVSPAMVPGDWLPIS